MHDLARTVADLGAHALANRIAGGGSLGELDASEQVYLARARGAPRALLFSCVVSDVRARLTRLPDQAALEAILADVLAGRPSDVGWGSAPYRFPASADVDQQVVRAVGSIAEAGAAPRALDGDWLRRLSSAVRYRPAAVLGGCLAEHFEPREEPRGDSMAARWDTLELEKSTDAELIQLLWAHGAVHHLESPVSELRSVLHAWWLEAEVSNGGFHQLLLNDPGFDLLAASDGLSRIDLPEAAALALELTTREIEPTDDDRYYAARDFKTFDDHIVRYLRCVPLTTRAN